MINSTSETANCIATFIIIFLASVLLFSGMSLCDVMGKDLTASTRRRGGKISKSSGSISIRDNDDDKKRKRRTRS